MAKPHTVELDPKGIPWYTGNANGTLGKIDPVTGQATVYKMPDPNAKDPHTLVFDQKGTAWFTLQNSNMVGRLYPETGEIKLITLPNADSACSNPNAKGRARLGITSATSATPTANSPPTPRPVMNR